MLLRRLMRASVSAALLCASVAAVAVVAAVGPSGVSRVVAQETGAAARPDSAAVARGLSHASPAVRRAAAEELARQASTEHRRLVEGYRLQERDASVRAALDWALYRMGRGERLFPLVSELDSKKHAEQVVGYLKQLETPEPLYVFLNRVNGNTKIRLLEVLAGVGDAGTLDAVRPFTESLDPGIADAAKFAEREITIRLEERPAVEPKRERKVGSADSPDPSR